MLRSRIQTHLLSLLAVLSLALTGCSETTGRALIPVNVALNGELNPTRIASLEIIVTDDGSELISRKTPYKPDSDGVARLAIYVDIESETEVQVTVRATDGDGDESASGGSDKVRLTPGGKSAPVNVVLYPNSGNDGGTDPDDASVGMDAEPSPVVDGGVKDTMAMPDAAVVINPTPKWSPAVNQEDDGSASSYSPVVAVAPNGDAVVAWVESNAVKTKKYTAATGQWGNIIQVDRRVSPGYVVIGVDGNGRTILVWNLAPDPTLEEDRGVWTSASLDGVNWTAPQPIWKGDTWEGLDMAVSRAGKARLVWEVPSKLNGDNVTTLWTSFFDNSVWSTPAMVAPSTMENSFYAKVAINAQDQGIIAYSQGGVFKESIWTSRFTGASVAAQVLMETLEERAFYPKVFLNGDGRGVLLWTQSTAASGLFARVFNGDAFLSQTQLSIGTSDGIPSAVVDKTGNITVVWASTAGANWNVSSTRLMLGGVWSMPVTLETMNRAGLYTDKDPEPCTGIDAAGNVLAVWRRDESPSNDYTFSVWGARLPVGGQWTAATMVHGIPMLRVLPVACGVSDNGVGVSAFFYRQDNALKLVDQPTYNVFTAIHR